MWKPFRVWFGGNCSVCGLVETVPCVPWDMDCKYFKCMNSVGEVDTETAIL
jgi:hypothetical protein